MNQGRLAEVILHITNCIYFCGGVVILVLGAVAIGSPQSIVNVMSYVPKINELSNILTLNHFATGPSIYLICEGSVVIILTFVGCGGAIKRKRPVVLTFGVLTLAMMLFNLAIIMFQMIDPYAIQGTVESNMNKTLTESFEPISIVNGSVVVYPTNAAANSWNLLQSTQSCCGVVGYEDYQNSWFNSSWYTDIGVSTALVPASCCMTVEAQWTPGFTSDFVNLTGCLTSVTPATYKYTQGCINYVMAAVTQYNFVWSVSAAGFTGLQAIILMLTLWLLFAHHDDKVGHESI